MLASIISWPLIAGCLLGATGLYLLLVARRGAALAVGAVSAALALVLLAMDFSSPAAWWSVPTPASPAASPLFILCGLLSIAAAGMTVTARTAAHAAIGFAATLTFVAGLYFAHGAHLLAAVALLAAGGGMGFVLLRPARIFAVIQSAAPQEIAKEPLLVCAAAGLLAAALLGTFDDALFATSVRDVGRLRAALARRESSLEPPAGHRAIDPSQPHFVQAGRSLFAGHPAAAGASAALLLVALLAGWTILREPPAARPGEANPPPSMETQQ